MKIVNSKNWTQDKNGKWWYSTPNIKYRIGGELIKCSFCGDFSPRVSSRKSNTGKYFCSRICGTRGTTEKRCLKGNLNHLWKGGKNVIRNGYIEIYKPDHPYCRGGKYVREHRLVMEEYLGRYLEPWEQVHHKNGIKDDNRLENLELISGKVHLGKVECPFCNKSFSIK